MDALRLFKITGEIDCYSSVEIEGEMRVQTSRRDCSVFVVCHDQDIALAIGKYQLNHGHRNLMGARVEKVSDSVYVAQINSHVH